MRKTNFFIDKWFILVATLFMLLPLIFTFSDILTRLVDSLLLYRWLQIFVVPLEIKLVGWIVQGFGVDYIPLQNGMIANNVELHLTWNCLGWQSLIFYLISLVIGFFGKVKYTWWSRIEVFVLGINGLFWINILRISFTVILAAHSMFFFKIIFHDVLAAMVAMGYLVFFWWFSYKYILVEKPD